MLHSLPQDAVPFFTSQNTLYEPNVYFGGVRRVLEESFAIFSKEELGIIKTRCQNPFISLCNGCCHVWLIGKRVVGNDKEV